MTQHVSLKKQNQNYLKKKFLMGVRLPLPLTVPSEPPVKFLKRSSPPGSALQSTLSALQPVPMAHLSYQADPQNYPFVFWTLGFLIVFLWSSSSSVLVQSDQRDL